MSSAEKPSKRYECEECKKSFLTNSNLKRHLKTIHKKTFEPCNNIQEKICAVCSQDTGKTIIDLQNHLRTAHEIEIEKQLMTFRNMSEFKRWKETEEKTSNSSFVRRNLPSKKSEAVTYYYYCHRSGYFKSKSTGKRKIKNQGSNKLNFFCPAQMKAKQFNSGRVDLEYAKTHVGHSLDVCRQKLSEEDKQRISSKISRNIPITQILEDVRTKTDSEVKRIHLLSRRDVLNIAKYHLNRVEPLPNNDAISVDAWINRLSGDDSPVICYKPKGVMSDDFLPLEKYDFLLVVMDLAQKEMLNGYGKNIVCVDSTQGTNAFLITILVVDEKSEGFPCVFIFSNKLDEKTVTFAFQNLQNAGINLEVTAFMTDTDDVYVNSWVKVFKKPLHHVWCTWDVDRAWRKKIKSIKSPEVQKVAHKKISALIKESDCKVFDEKMDAAVRDFSSNSETGSFCKYFSTYYSKCAEKWACCHRKWLGVNTTNALENAHKVLKCTYMDGKKIKRLDKCLHSLMRFVQDKQFDRFVLLIRGNVFSKQTTLWDRHATSLQLSLDDVIVRENRWIVKSRTNDGELHEVERRDKICSQPCPLICVECGYCYHQFRCTCVDNCIKSNMCEHIHLVCRTFERITVTLVPVMEVNEENSELMICDNGQRSQGNELYDTVLSEDNSSCKDVEKSRFLLEKFNKKIEELNANGQTELADSVISEALAKIKAKKIKCKKT